MNIYSFILIIFSILSEKPKEHLPKIEVGFDYYVQFCGSYTLDRERSHIQQIGEEKYLRVILVRDDVRVEYYEIVENTKLLSEIHEFRVSAEIICELPCDQLTAVKIEGCDKSGKVIYEKTDIFDKFGESCFPRLPPKPAPPTPTKEDKKKPAGDLGKKAIVKTQAPDYGRGFFIQHQIFPIEKFGAGFISSLPLENPHANFHLKDSYSKPSYLHSM